MATGSDETGATPESSPEPAEARPTLRIINGDATPEEIAALVAVVSSLGGAAPAPVEPRHEWGAAHRQVRRTLPHGPGGWRSSSLPG